MGKHKVLSVVGFLLILFADITRAQVSTGTISGTVKDAANAAIPDANVVVLSEDTGISRTIKTDKEGHYSAPGLNSGNYRVTGSKDGFRTEIRGGIVMTVARDETVDLSLAVGSATETVEVNGQPPLVDTNDPGLGTLVDGRTIRSLPLNGRSLDQLAIIQPGVIRADPGQSNIPLQYGSGARFTVGGQRPTSNLFLLDGTDINDHSNSTPGGASGSLLGVDSIQEFRILTNWFNAEYGHSSGAVVSSVTRAGTDNFHGTVFEYFRNSAMDARNYFDTPGAPPPPFNKNQFGGVLGGPIKKNKAFFFTGYEGFRQTLATTLTATVPTLLTRQGTVPCVVNTTTCKTGTITVPVNPAIVPYLAYWPLPNGRDYGDGTGVFTSAPSAQTHDDNVIGRIDYQVNSKLSVFARYVFDTDAVNLPSSLPYASTTTQDGRHYGTIQANMALTERAFNNIRFAYNRSAATIVGVSNDPNTLKLAFVPGQDMGTITVGSINSGNTITQLGVSSGNGDYIYAFGNYGFNDDFSYTRGRHTIKTGVSIERIQDNFDNPGSVRGAYAFSNLQTFITASAPTFTVAVPVGVLPYWGMRQTMMGVYVQDDFKARSNLIFNYGLRWEAVTNPYDVHGRTAALPSFTAPALLPTSHVFEVGKANFAPRVGVDWRVNASGKTSVRAGFGIYYNEMTPVTYSSYVRVPPFFAQQQATNAPFPNGVQAALTSGIPSLTEINQNQKTPVDLQYNVSFQQQLSRALVFQAYYAGSKASNTSMAIPKNTFIPLSVTNNQPIFAASGGVRPNANFAQISDIEPLGRGRYDAGTVMLRSQSAKGLVGQVFYTFSKSMDLNSSTQTADSRRSPGQPMNFYNIEQDWALSDYNAKHRFGLNGTYPIPYRTESKVLGPVVNGWTLDAIVSISSGLPLTPILVSSQSKSGSTTNADRPNLRPGFSNSPTHGVSAGCTGVLAGTQLGGAATYFDPCAFSVPTVGTFGNLGRNTVIGPGYIGSDLALEKNFPLREAVYLTFRGEVFNVLNHTNLGLPNNSTLATTGAANGSAGTVIYTVGSSRQIEFAFRLHF